MKKMNKFIVAASLTAGVIGCFGAAFALYKKAESPLNIGIGKVTTHGDSTAVINYSFGDGVTAYKDETLKNTISLKDNVISPEINKVYLKVPLQFKYTTEDANFTSQGTTVGRFSVTVDINEKVRTAGDVVVGAKLCGYEKVTITGDDQQNYDVDTYFTAEKTKNFFDTTFNNETTTKVTKYIDTAVDKTSIYCVISIDMSAAMTDDNYKYYDLVNELKTGNAFDVSLNWEGYKSTLANFDTKLVPNAYVRGDYSDWGIREGYQMVPNIKGRVNIGSDDKNWEWGVEWTYKILKNFSVIKVYDESDTLVNDSGWVYCRGVAAGSGATKEDNGNATLDSTKTYNIYYKRNCKTETGFWVDPGSENVD